MKTRTTCLVSAALACMLLISPLFGATFGATDWYALLDEVQQASQQNAGGRARANAILTDVLHAVQNGLSAPAATGRALEAPPLGADLEAASAQAAYSALVVLYPENLPALDDRFRGALSRCVGSASAIAAGRQWGEHVAEVILAQHGDAVALNPGSFVQAAKAPDLPPAATAAQPAEGEPGSDIFQFSVLAGTHGSRGHVDGIGAAARFDNPTRLAVDAAGNVYVSEYTLCTIRKITPNGEVTTLAGTAGQRGDLDGAGAAARFNAPLGLAVDAAGNVFVADSGNHTIRKIDPAGNVTTVAGRSGIKGSADGPKGTAELNSPNRLVVDGSGNLFLLEEESSRNIRRIAPNGMVTTTSIKFTASLAYYETLFITHLALDREGNLYAFYSDDWLVNDVLKLTPTAEGNYTATPYVGFGEAIIEAMGFDEAGNLYAYNIYDARSIIVTTPDKQSKTYRHIEPGFAHWTHWNEIAVGRYGTLYGLRNVAYPTTTAVSIGILDPLESGVVILTEPSNTIGSLGSRVSFQVKAFGNSPLTYQWYYNDVPIAGAGATGIELTVTPIRREDLGFYHVVVTDSASGKKAISRKAELTLFAPTPSSPSTSAPAAASSSTGGGSIDRGLALALLSLLAAASHGRSPRMKAVPRNLP